MSSLELKVPPLLLTVLFGVLVVVAASVLHEASFAVVGALIVGVLLIVVGVIVCLVGVAEFRRLRTTVNPTTPGAASTLATDGVYRFSRNPMYLGFAAMLFGLALILSNWLSLAVACLFIAYMNRFQIGPEERALTARFGQAFDDYRRRVRRWI